MWRHNHAFRLNTKAKHDRVLSSSFQLETSISFTFIYSCLPSDVSAAATMLLSLISLLSIASETQGKASLLFIIKLQPLSMSKSWRHHKSVFLVTYDYIRVHDIEELLPWEWDRPVAHKNTQLSERKKSLFSVSCVCPTLLNNSNLGRITIKQQPLYIRTAYTPRLKLGIWH